MIPSTHFSERANDGEPLRGCDDRRVAREAASAAVARFDARLRGTLADDAVTLDVVRTQLRMRVTSKLYAAKLGVSGLGDQVHAMADAALCELAPSVIEPFVLARERAMFAGPVIRYGARMFHGGAPVRDSGHRSIVTSATSVAVAPLDREPAGCLCEALLDEVVFATTRRAMDAFRRGVTHPRRSTASEISDAARRLRVDAGFLARPDRSAEAIVGGLRRRGEWLNADDAAVVALLFRYLHGFDRPMTFVSFMERVSIRVFGDADRRGRVSETISRVLATAREDTQLSLLVERNVDRVWCSRFLFSSDSDDLHESTNLSDPATELVRRLVRELPRSRVATPSAVERALVRVAQSTDPDAKCAERLRNAPGAASALAKFINEERMVVTG